MKPITTWIVLANAKIIRVISNSGPGKGLKAMDGKTWHAPEVVEYADEPGVSQSSAGPGRPSLARPDTRHLAEADFAKDVVAKLAALQRENAFDRLILVGAPHMLGTLRSVLPPALAAIVTGELDKDLTQVPLDDLARHLEDLLAV